ncbi:hypothetical protein FRC09_013642 [Ceratobasidium sp. 395]|nr:hypothetical protein FRC09_013642 [Ceratobasidium sp. 395]
MAAAPAADSNTGEDSGKSKPEISSKPAPRSKRARTDKEVTQAPKRRKNSLKHIPDMPPEVFNENCGTKVLRHMDPFLRVRLCNSCRDEQVIKIWSWDDLSWAVPQSNLIKAIGHSYNYTLRSEIEKAKERNKDEQQFPPSWMGARMAELEELHKHGEMLRKHLKKIDNKQSVELGNIREQRIKEIETRLLKNGWTKRDMDTYPGSTANEWNKLVYQSKPITDRIWSNLYPKLVPLLESNRAHYNRLDREERKRNCITRIDDLATKVRQALPPLMHVTLKRPLENGDTLEPAVPAGLEQAAPTSDNVSDIKVNMPFPSTPELLAWPMITSIVEADMSVEDTEERFDDMREEFNLAVVEWRNKVEENLMDIWDVGQTEDSENEAEPVASANEGKGKATVHTGTKGDTHGTKEYEPTTYPSPVQLVLPDFTVTFTKPDGTTTTDISDLLPKMQTLLRADTMFRSRYCYYTYPAIVPVPTPPNRYSGVFDEGKPWNTDGVGRHVAASAVAIQLLALVGRPDATGAEMSAIGKRFRCGRCLPDILLTWEELVIHYTLSQSRWEKVQEQLKDNLKSQYTFRDLHDLGQPNAKPFAYLMTTQAAADFTAECAANDTYSTKCYLCESLGLQAWYQRAFKAEIEGTMIRHLRDV